MLFGDVQPDRGPAFWTAFFATLPTLIAAISAAVVAVIAALKGQQNSVKADIAIRQNEQLLRQGNGIIEAAAKAAHDVGYAKGVASSRQLNVVNIPLDCPFVQPAVPPSKADKPTT